MKKDVLGSFCFIFDLLFLCKSCSAFQELSNDIQHDHIFKNFFQSYVFGGLKSAILAFCDYAPPL